MLVCMLYARNYLCAHACMHGPMDGWTEGQKDKWADGRVYAHVEVCKWVSQWLEAPPVLAHYMDYLYSLIGAFVCVFACLFA